ncbi:hypothetical protein [uncultured Thiodictyon sp.]|jgi:hypothetical protein|uniref:DUF7281 domain-containing protein n=1 Tax=uncultured Thiodictyon sp. TaxID=1846217 RepID=UPI0025FEF7F9|nr:hypothetical protein [uncultured Thiodictyon sp.]
MSTLDKLTVRALLRILHAPGERFAGRRVLKTFSDDYRIGRTKGTAVLFESHDKARIRELLCAEGIDPATDPAAWDGLTRAAAAHLGPDEKFTSSAVKRIRVAIKTLPGRPLNLDGRALILPPTCHLDVEGPAVAGLLAHRSVLLVENWECFNRIHDAVLDLSPAGENPLVVWRGDASGTRVDHALGLLKALDVPVWAFVDYDPAGLLIADALPHLAGLIAPGAEQLERDLARGLPGRYQIQLPMAIAALDATTSEPVRSLWTIIRRHGRALPQERYLSESVTADETLGADTLGETNLPNGFAVNTGV